jgi:Zn finger protein HypA/HybF involved in hydrogenase expression
MKEEKQVLHCMHCNTSKEAKTKQNKNASKKCPNCKATMELVDAGSKISRRKAKRIIKSGQ